MLHFSWNFFQGPVFGFEVSGINFGSIITQSVSGHELITGGEFGFEGSILASCLTALAIILVHFFYRKERKEIA